MAHLEREFLELTNFAKFKRLIRVIRKFAEFALRFA